MFRSEVPAFSQVRFSEISSDLVDGTPLVTLVRLKELFGVTGNELDVPLSLASDIVSAVIRRYCGRTFSRANYTEVFRDVLEQKPERYLIEVPVHSVVVSSDYSLLNGNTGRVVMTGGPAITITYDGGYDELPADLLGVYRELVRQQMSVMGYDTIGSTDTTTPPERAVWVGTLKVEYATGANTPQARAAGAGAMSNDALAPYSFILDSYQSYRAVVAT